VICPLCGVRRAKRSCPGVGQQICPVCCGTKRLTEINCPPDCVYLASAREHPPAVAVRQQQRDVGALVQSMRDFTDRQTQLFFLTASVLVRYQPPELQTLVDEDVAAAAGALAGTFETAARGVIYEHRAPSLAAERLAAALKPVLLEAGKGVAGTAFERDAALVLRRLEEAALKGGDANNRRAFVEMLGRVIKPRDAAPDPSTERREESRLIIP
jgi:hypothetical protein